MTRCSNVRSLSISIHQGGCVIGSDINSFDWKQGDKFSTLDELELSGYGWINQRHSRSGHPRPLSPIWWKAAMDWSRLKRIDIDRPPIQFLEAFQCELTGLESFKIRPEWGFWGDEDTFCSFDQNATMLRNNYTSFIKSLPPLRELSIGGMGELLNVTDILEVHGPSLENLTIHEFESDCRPGCNETWGRPTFSVKDLRSINEMAPVLTSLEVDVYRRGSWPHHIFSTLSQFQNLKMLTLWFDLKNPHEQIQARPCARTANYCMMNPAMEPRLDKKAALQIFKELTAAQKSKKLDTLTLYTGDVNRHQGGGLRLGRGYDTDYSPTQFECKIVSGMPKCFKVHGFNDWDF
jgi:hypothetical protein